MQYPPKEHEDRINSYYHNQLLLEGNHYDVFAIKGQKDFSEEYNRLRYVVSNFCGLVAKVAADYLFVEPVKLKVDKNQQWLDNLWFDNKMQTQTWESALSCAAIGDALWKIRVEENEIKMDDVNPGIWFPRLNVVNNRAKFETEELGWVETYTVDEIPENYLVKEIHEPQQIRVEVYRVQEVYKGACKFEVDRQVDLNWYNDRFGTNYVELTKTNIDDNLLVHIKNMTYRGNSSPFGFSDFQDLETLQFELNNRVTRNANILDKHSKPILGLPKGILDENNKVNLQQFEAFELGEDGQPPVYVVWDAKLEAAFQQIDKILELAFMVSETSPDVLGLGKGQAETGRALKMRLIRTIAKRDRKRLYYDQGLKEVLKLAQELAVANGYTVRGQRIKEVEDVELIWSDGIVNDEYEQVEIVGRRLEQGTMSKETAIITLDNKTNEQVLAEVEKIRQDESTFTSFADGQD